jgi:hypothetical protein
MDNIRNPAKLKQYRQMIYEKLLQEMEQTDVNHEWKNIKSTTLESAEEIITIQDKYICNDWWDEAYK